MFRARSSKPLSVHYKCGINSIPNPEALGLWKWCHYSRKFTDTRTSTVFYQFSSTIALECSYSVPLQTGSGLENYTCFRFNTIITKYCALCITIFGYITM